jgi:oxygen-independent coproporphyrinogen-3 oxidase
MADFYEGVYIHTPFCLQKCLYCDFASYAGLSKTVQEKYVQALCKEITLRGKNVKPTATIYFGGGTPSVLETEQLATYCAALKRAGCLAATNRSYDRSKSWYGRFSKVKSAESIGF